MFLCAVTGITSKPREPMVKVVVETRPRTYINVVDGVEVESHGIEIVQEIGVTKAGLGTLLLKRPDLAEQFQQAVEERRWRTRPVTTDDDDTDDSDDRSWAV